MWLSLINTSTVFPEFCWFFGWSFSLQRVWRSMMVKWEKPCDWSSPTDCCFWNGPMIEAFLSSSLLESDEKTAKQGESVREDTKQRAGFTSARLVVSDFNYQQTNQHVQCKLQGSCLLLCLRCSSLFVTWWQTAISSGIHIFPKHSCCQLISSPVWPRP